MSDGDATRARLISAAERLFAAHGVEAVSLREIGRAAGAKNIAAAQYHFSDRAGLIGAILEKHTPGVSLTRHALLDECDAQDAELRDLASALVVPLATKLTDAEGGPDYLRIYAELVNRPGGLGVPLVEGKRNSIERWAAMVAPAFGLTGDILHRRFLAVRVTASELGRRAHVRPAADQRLFIENLIDVVTAIVQARAAPATTALVRRPRGRPAFRTSDREL